MVLLNLMGISLAIALFFSPFVVALVVADFMNGGRSKKAFTDFVERRYPIMSVEKRDALTSRLARHFVIAGFVWILILLAASYTAPSWLFPFWGSIAHALFK